MALSEKQLNENGWHYEYYYPAGNENMFKNNRGLYLRVAKDYSYSLTYCGAPMRQIDTIEQLLEYEIKRK